MREMAEVQAANTSNTKNSVPNRMPPGWGGVYFFLRFLRFAVC